MSFKNIPLGLPSNFLFHTLFSMPDLKKLDEALNQHIHPETFPLAIKMAQKGEALPEKIKRPVGDLGVQVATCQGFSLARRYGWSLDSFIDATAGCRITHKELTA